MLICQYNIYIYILVDIGLVENMFSIGKDNITMCCDYCYNIKLILCIYDRNA